MPELGTIILVAITILWLWIVMRVQFMDDGARLAFCFVGTVALWVFNVLGLGVVGLAFMLYNRVAN